MISDELKTWTKAFRRGAVVAGAIAAIGSAKVNPVAEAMLALIKPSELVALGARIVSELLPRASEQIERAREEANLSDDPDSQFERFKDGLTTIERLGSSEASTIELIENPRDAVQAAVDDVGERKKEKEKEEDDHSED